MANLNMSIPHNLKQDDARRRVDKLMKDFTDHYAGQISKLKEDWKGNVCAYSFEAEGYLVSGTLTVKETEIELTGEIPYPASLFMSMIEATILEKAKALLG